jgi:hypothetical protein
LDFGQEAAQKSVYWQQKDTLAEYRPMSDSYVAHRMQHSKKPDEIRDRIVELCGDLP